MLDNTGILTIALTQNEAGLLKRLAKLDLSFSLQTILNQPVPNNDKFSLIYHLCLNFEAFSALMTWANDEFRAFRQVNAMTIFIIRNLIEGFLDLPNIEQIPDIVADVKIHGANIIAAGNKALGAAIEQPFLPVSLTNIKVKA